VSFIGFGEYKCSLSGLEVLRPLWGLDKMCPLLGLEKISVISRV
jgi:hypothetical protein